MSRSAKQPFECPPKLRFPAAVIVRVIIIVRVGAVVLVGLRLAFFVAKTVVVIRAALKAFNLPA